jgi:hypothetical protein
LKFLLVFLLDTMVHIVEHHVFVLEDFPMEEEAASSMPRASSRPALGAVAAVRSARQHTPVQVSRASRAALVHCPQPGSCCATLLAPRPRQGP